ncbi:MAG TPA: hypothetical protein VMF89_19440, partial [Polyangiales bacterium]|nr:hypothetical protein [Polyangiales bacterium]
QAARTSQDPWESKVRQYLCGRKEITDLAPLLDYLGVATERQTASQLTRVGIILHKLGCATKQRRVNGEREYYRTVPPKLASQPLQTYRPDAAARRDALIADLL